MKSVKEITRMYNKMLASCGKVDANRVNCYVCTNCKHITKTIDVDDGVTPFMHTCEKCGKLATSTMYKDIIPWEKPTQEWYRPSLKETLKWRKNEGMLNHILNGGLDVRTIKTER